jgi:acetyl-CoA carboxylase biotin carboxyl carrier protein
MKPTIKDAKEILEIFLDSELQDLRLEIGELRLALTKSGTEGVVALPFSSPPAPHPVTAPTAALEPAPNASASTAINASPTARSDCVAVTSPSVGVFYRRPSPDQPPFVEVGKEVQANDTVCLIEIMKMFTAVLAPCRGRIVEILIDDASKVEHGEPLMYILAV